MNVSTGMYFHLHRPKKKYINKIRDQVVLKCLVFYLIGSKGGGNCRGEVYWGKGLSSSVVISFKPVSRVLCRENSRTGLRERQSLCAVRISCCFLFAPSSRRSQIVSYS